MLSDPNTELPVKYVPTSLSSIPVYNETGSIHLTSILYHVVVEENLHTTDEICHRAGELGVFCSPYTVRSTLGVDDSFIQIQDGFWEHRQVLTDAIEEVILGNKVGFSVRTSRGMPELEAVIRPASLISKMDRYLGLNPAYFAEAVLECIQANHQCNLVAVNCAIVNFKEAFIKDIYNVLLRERTALSSLDIALRLFDSKVGVYKKSLKDLVTIKNGKTLTKIMHHPLHPNEIYRLSRLIEHTVVYVCDTRPTIFHCSGDGLINAHRNHIGIFRIKLTQEDQLVINMANEFDITTNVERIIDANKRFLTKLIGQFKNNIDEEEIHSRFYEKLWQSVLQYDEVWGHKFHTFLHRALKNILLDEQTKKQKVPPFISLNAAINERDGDELGSLIQDRNHAHLFDPTKRVSEIHLVEMVQQKFPADQQEIIFMLMDGMKDRDIADSLNKSVSDVVKIKKKLSKSQNLIQWFYLGDAPHRKIA